MKIEYNLVPTMTLEEFADQHGLVMSVNERGRDAICKWPYYASFKNAEVKEGECLVSSYGNGTTPEDAIKEYAKEISETLLVLNAMSPHRKEIRVPRLTG